MHSSLGDKTEALAQKKKKKKKRGCPYIPVSDHPVLLPTDHALWDHTAQNLLRMGLAFLVLVALVWFLVEDWLSRKRTRERASRASTWEGRRRLNTKTL